MTRRSAVPLKTRWKRIFKEWQAALTPPDRRPGVSILIYHKVGSPLGSELNVPLPEFRAQMAYLKAHRRVLHLQEAVRALDQGGPDHEVVVITFDDGYRHVLNHAFPALGEFALPATVYVCPGYVTGGKRLPWEREASERVMDWSELRALTQGGLVRCGSHTWSHRVLPGAATAEMDRELRQSRLEIEERLGVAAPDFCYPKALWDFRSDALVRQVYGTAVVGGCRRNRAPADPLRLWRIPVGWSDDAALFRAKLDGRVHAESLHSGPRRLLYGLTGRWPQY